jgi:DNA-binding NarL/FixJ family response regulator
MIAYRALQTDAVSDVGRENELAHLQPIHETGDHPDGRVTVAVPSPAAPDGSGPLIAIIDPRTLGRDSLALALETGQGRFRSLSFADLGEWLQNEQVHGKTAAILLGIGSTDAGDPGLAEDLQHLARAFSHIPAIVLGDVEDPLHVLKILGHGARGYIPTSVSLSVAVEAISLARAGGLFVPASSLTPFRQTPAERTQAASPVERLLTDRQAAVAEAVSKGKANKIIAYELNLCESTVKVHIRSIMKKLQARNRTEVAFKLHSLTARQAGLAKSWPSAMRA